MLYIRACHVVPIHDLHDTSITPTHPTGYRGGKLHLSSLYLQRITAHEVPLWKPYAIKISCAIYTYVLATYYLYTIYMIPLQHPTHPTGGYRVDPRWISNMLATHDLLTALHTSCATDTLPSPHPL